MQKNGRNILNNTIKILNFIIAYNIKLIFIYNFKNNIKLFNKPMCYNMVCFLYLCATIWGFITYENSHYGTFHNNTFHNETSHNRSFIIVFFLMSTIIGKVLHIVYIV